MAVQTFLPLITPDKRVLGLVPITSTDFTGAETTFTLSGRVYPVQRVSYKSLVGNTFDRGVDVDYMAISVSLSQEREEFRNHGYISSSLASQARDTRFWRNAPNGFSKTRYTGTLVAFVLRGNSVAAPAPVPSGGNGSNASVNFSVNSPFSNVAQAEFFDTNWQQMLGVDVAPASPASVSIGTASADPGSGNMLRAYVVQQGLQVVNNVATYSTIRVVKVFPGPVTAGTYTWPLTVTRVDGTTVTLNYSVVVA